MVRKLFNEKERNPEPEDPYVTTKMPLTDLDVYSELIEALPSIEEEFFRTPLTEEERKEAIHSCPRKPETKSLMVQEKLETLIASKKPEKRSRDRKPFRGRQQYGTQNSTGSKIAHAQTTEAATTPATVNNPRTQSLDWTPGRGPTRDVQVSMEPNYGQKIGAQHRRERVLNSLQKIGTAKQGFREIQKRCEMLNEEFAESPKSDNYGSTTTDTSPKTPQEENGSRRTRSPDNRSGINIDHESDRGSEDKRSGILQQSVRNTKDYRGTQTSLGPEETESPCTGAEL
ncbi:hypothetical protein AYI69_g3720 [Smittium culicis]|uniref:Uncharacterized protein n=1 Tax=Smittium culicis TaxID=133412 RepID=A0A1R1YIW7_9FUNG|nr:hypothetical protein AYI69_g3720 [Smittium culicis]